MSESGGGPIVYIYELEIAQTPVNVPYIDGDNRPTDDTGNTVLYSVYTSTSFTIDLQLFTLQIKKTISNNFPAFVSDLVDYIWEGKC